MSDITILKVGDQQVKIEVGELVGYQVSGHEYMHQKGNPGWRSVEPGSCEKKSNTRLGS